MTYSIKSKALSLAIKFKNIINLVQKPSQNKRNIRKAFISINKINSLLKVSLIGERNDTVYEVSRIKQNFSIN